MASRFRAAAQKVAEEAVVTADTQAAPQSKRHSIAQLLRTNKFKRLLNKKKEQAKSGDGLGNKPQRKFLFDDNALQKGASLQELFIDKEEVLEDFNEIVDQDDDRVETFVSQIMVGHMIESVIFRTVILFLITVNAVLIGLQTDERLSADYQYAFSIFDQCVLTVFTCELLLKWYYGFSIFWKVGWNILDFVIILALLLGPTLSFLGSSRILRILRVLRAFRSLRSISALAGLSMVVQTILQSIPDMANIGFLLCIILLVFSVMGTTLFAEAVPRYFGTLPDAMFSLFICVTQDGWMNIFEEFKKVGGGYYIGGMFYFFCAIMVGAFVFANLVVAVVVTNLELAMTEVREEQMAQEDLLGTDTGGAEEEDNVPVIHISKVLDKAHPSRQTPIILADLNGADSEDIQALALALTALEENLAEYTAIRKDMQLIFDVVLELNLRDDLENLVDDGDMPPPTSGADGAAGTSAKPATDFNFENFATKGDIISNLMSLEKHRGITSENADLKGVIKQAALAIDDKSVWLNRTKSYIRKKSQASLTRMQQASATRMMMMKDDDDDEG